MVKSRKSLLAIIVSLSFGLISCACATARTTRVVRRLVQQSLTQPGGNRLFSFEYGGAASGSLLPGWKRHSYIIRENSGERRTMTWDDPMTGLRVEWSVLLFDHHDAAEMRLAFENRGTRPTPLIRNVRPLFQSLPTPIDIVYAKGGLATPSDFEPTITRLSADSPDLKISAEGGWSSNRNLPFWLFLSPGGGGFYCGLGWTGQWAADFTVSKDGRLSAQAGMEHLDLSLEPGERITQPTILIGHFTGGRMAGHNALRRILDEQYVPTIGGKKMLPPTADETWIPYGNGINEKLLLDQIQAMAPVGIDVLLLDPGWYMVDFWDAGDWRVNPTNFPHGLQPIASALASKGMKMGLWMDPERVTDLCYDAFPRKDLLVRASEHAAKERGRDIKVWLVDLARPEARKWMVDMIGEKVRALPLGWLHWDLNYPPLEMWLNKYKDHPDRLGIEEIRYVEGVYEVLDTLKRDHPDLIIHWSAGSGRRIDLETLRRCHVMAKSDLVTDAGHMMLCASNLFFPGNLVGIASGQTSRYDYYRHFAGPFLACYDFRNQTPEQIREATAYVATYKRIRKYLCKDYYPLFEYSLDPEKWTGWQFHDRKTSEGFFTVFRQPDAPNSDQTVKLYGLDPKTVYSLSPDVRCNLPQSATGKSLMDGFLVRLDEPRSTLLVEYGTAR